jgi:EAL domain
MAVEAEDLAARLKAEFPHALRTGQLVAYYQPEVELSSGRVVAAESLVRWEHPEFGTLRPALFTPVAEQLGLMGELTRLMLRLSLVQHRVWAAAGWAGDRAGARRPRVGRPGRPVAAPGHRSGGRSDAGRRGGHHGGLRAVAGLSLGPPASGPDRGPGVLPAERGRRVLRLAGIAPHRPRPGHWPGLAAAFDRDLALPARRRDPAGLRGGLAPAAGPDLGRRRLPRLLPGGLRRLVRLPVAAPDQAGTPAQPARRRRRRGRPRPGPASCPTSRSRAAICSSPSSACGTWTSIPSAACCSARCC